MLLKVSWLALSASLRSVPLPLSVAYATSSPGRGGGKSVKGRGKNLTVTPLALPLGELARNEVTRLRGRGR